MDVESLEKVIGTAGGVATTGASSREMEERAQDDLITANQESESCFQEVGGSAGEIMLSLRAILSQSFSRSSGLACDEL